MEITIKSQCPNCKEDFVFKHESKILHSEKKPETFDEEELIGDSFFNIMKRATLEQNELYDDLYEIVGENAIKDPGLPKSVRLILKISNKSNR